jgi:hypothetical protein
MEKKSEYGQYVYGSLNPTITDSQYNKRLKK